MSNGLSWFLRLVVASMRRWEVGRRLGAMKNVYCIVSRYLVFPAACALHFLRRVMACRSWFRRHIVVWDAGKLGVGSVR